MRITNLFALGVMMSALAWSQVETSSVGPSADSQTTSINADDPELYFGFLSLCRAVENDAQASEAERGVKLRRAMAQHLGIADADFAALLNVATTVLGQVSSLSDDAKSYYLAEGAAGRVPPRTKLDVFQKRRAALLLGGARSLQSAMSPAGWTAIHAYINDTYRNSLIRRDLKNGK
jgi:hypothetical protein